jgi:hypothetical protein
VDTWGEPCNPYLSMPVLAASNDPTGANLTWTFPNVNECNYPDDNAGTNCGTASMTENQRAALMVRVPLAMLASISLLHRRVYMRRGIAIKRAPRDVLIQPTLPGPGPTAGRDALLPLARCVYP